MRGVNLAKNAHEKSQIRRGRVYWVHFDGNRGSEQGGLRPALVLQNDKGNRYSPTTIVIPLTTRLKPQMPTHFEFYDAEHGFQTACAEQVRTVDKARISEFMCELDEEDMKSVEDCFRCAVSDLRARDVPAVRRGEVYQCRLDGGVGSEETGVCPVLIVQNNKGNLYAPTTIAVPILNPREKALPTHVDIVLGGKKKVVATEQIRTIDKGRLLDKIAVLPASVMEQVGMAMTVAVAKKV